MPLHGLSGRRCSTAPDTGIAGRVDWFTTISRTRGRPQTPGDLRYRPLQGGGGRLLLIVLDSSGSTLKDYVLSAAKGAIGSLIEAAYRQRLRIGILQLAGKGVWLSVPPQRAAKHIIELIQDIKGGGGTPLRRALEEAVRVLKWERKRFPHEQQTLMLFTDGRSRDRIDDIPIPCRTWVIDMETAPVRLRRCEQLASRLNGQYLTLHDLPIKRQR